MEMRLSELIERLTELQEELADEGTEDAVVRLAMQPSYPLEHRICTEVVAVESDDAPTAKVVYIAEGGQVGYLAGAVSMALGWR